VVVALYRLVLMEVQVYFHLSHAQVEVEVLQSTMEYQTMLDLVVQVEVLLDHNQIVV
jgi:hypothetical protein